VSGGDEPKIGAGTNFLVCTANPKKDRRSGMENTAVKEEKLETPTTAGAPTPADPQSPPAQPTLEHAKRYLDTFYPGWDLYLKEKEF
jgi:hypothetical protein